MPEAPKPLELPYRHWVSFVSGDQPFAVVLPDRKLYDAFSTWLRGEGPRGYSFPYKGQEMSINFAHVQRMEVEKVVDSEARTGTGGGNPVPLRVPPPLE